MGRRNEDTPPNTVIWQAVQQNHEQAEDGHRRVRNDIRELEARFGSMQSTMTAQAQRLALLEQMPTDVTKLSFNTKTMVAIVAAAVSVAGAQWASNASLERKLTAAIEANTQAQTARATALADSIKAVERRQELQQYEFQKFKEEIMRQTRMR